MVEQTIGPYRVVRLLGQGGMGKVFEAVHRVEGTRVAIKVLRSEYASDEQMAARFANEARAIKLVEHPGVVRIYAVGSLDNGEAYIAMEYLAGQSLRERLKHPSARLDALAVARDIALTLTAVHQKKIIHRDLKPENVMLVPDPSQPGREQVKVLDFGIAKLAANSQITEIRTQTGVHIGTPTYMAPEQCGGEGLVCDRTDVYAFACMLFEMLAGQPPFTGDQDAQLIGRHLFRKPPQLSEFVPSAGSGLVELIDQMLAKAPEARPAMGEVASRIASLGSFLPGLRIETTSAPHPATTVQVDPQASFTVIGSVQPMRNHPARRTMVWIGSALVCTSLGFWTLASLRSPALPARPVISEVRPSVPPTPSTALVHWSIVSIPTDVEVIDGNSGAVLGHTPWSTQRQPSSEQQELILRKLGFRDIRLKLDQRVDVAREVQLLAQPLIAKTVHAEDTQAGRLAHKKAAASPVKAPLKLTKPQVAAATHVPEPPNATPEPIKAVIPASEQRRPMRNTEVPLL